MTAFMSESFELSKWFNRTESKFTNMSSTMDKDSTVTTDENKNTGDPNDIEMTHCFVCRTPNPEYLSTNTVKGAPSVPVCSLSCESEYLKRKGWKASAKGGGKYVELGSESASNSKKSKRDDVVVLTIDDDDDAEEKTDSKRQKCSFDLLESNNGNGYKSWWLGALAFYDFVYQRHGMWHSYSMGNNEPRVDPVLLKYWSCNIYRELDRSTAYLRKHALRWQKRHHNRLSMREVLWITICFRYCNRLETFDKAGGIPSSDMFASFSKRMQTLAKQKENNELFANRTTLTVEQYLSILGLVQNELDTLTTDIKSCTSTQQVFNQLRSFHENALGSFTCWQITCDLVELGLFSDLEFVSNDYVWLSLESQQSLIQIFGKQRARPSEFVSLVKVLVQRQAQGFQSLNVLFPYFMNQNLNLKNMGHALHQFQVYRNMKLLQSHQFDSLHAHGTAAPIPYLSRSYLLDKEACELCQRSENEDELVLCDLCNSLFHKYCLKMKELPPASWVCEACKAMMHIPQQGLVVMDTEEEVILIE